MTEACSPRLFASDADVIRIGEGLLARTLPRADWTHEAHLAACLWLLAERPDIDVDARIAWIIARYNESAGGVNDDTQGYHDTITHVYVAGVRHFLRGWRGDAGLAARANALLLSPVGRRDWPLGFYSRDLLFSVAARRGFVPPDRAPLPGAC
ncbi:hypothetical protein ACFQ1E_12360 [Sphingomonas canadensis]|uniref:Uncharacterized protein n=1 Tax=Sphingomonas canadensis TaxID=1219257 RepID=A0ABW3H778_9SPHN|nr:hypothetical protein [Sphingomonas canadensis]MCW3836732.1 hypothetical protein [Sphingomonas canadensis]